MAIHYHDEHAVLESHASVEDAEVLGQWLRERPGRAVDLGACDHVHAAVLQVLLALRPPVRTPPPNRWLALAVGCATATA